MRPFIFTICFAIAAHIGAQAQSLIQIPYAPTPTIDGTISSNEWDESDAILLPIINETDHVTVRFMHDSTNLHFAFIGNLESTNTRFPEVLLDIENDKSSDWEMDDWWFHVSGTDCEYQGDHSNYDSCELVRHNWTGERNFLMTTPTTDTVEIQIPFSTIHLNLQQHDTIGIAFDVTNTFNSWEFWPTNTDMDEPSTWANAVFLNKGNSNIQRKVARPLNIYPNPSSGNLRISTSNIPSGIYRLEVLNMMGQIVYSSENIKPNANNIQVRVPATAGIYSLNLTSAQHSFIGKVNITK